MWFAEKIGLSDDIDMVSDWFYENRLTDGLPIIPPTPERVEKTVLASGLDSDEVIAVLPPMNSVATVGAIAANGVMAGCRPEYVQVLIAAAKALGNEELDLTAIQSSASGYALLVLINGPVRNILGVNCAGNAWGQGFRANASIGRAVSLMVTTIAGIGHRKADNATQGNPGQYTLCLGEHEERSPWEPYHVERGFGIQENTVTIAGATSEGLWAHNKDYDALNILATMARVLPVRGPARQLLVCLCPERAADIAKGGFSKKDVKQFLYEHSRRPVQYHKMMGTWRPEQDHFYSPLIDPGDDHALVPAALSPEDYVIIVAGGAGGISEFYELSGRPSGDMTPTEGPKGDAVTVKIEI